ncbi:bifunctional helix-turn-helix transcriptional regulator/GNAT family N-acetyltransferase [Methylobacterium oryzihabitans]|uniref:MarR family transcriptional regulator n=1 Tax=Methylobacterium oryzihabitans TaxID=2499852 RepID=A0A437P6H7_9HYPH|nr:helix-turn-helix domain-containing GNAT family N-acetyltransferase [Methylobacterium oryzihabitans]RVU17863.1 MarR family transcriptional regulator [Methylobacterium oryzihabitans]
MVDDASALIEPIRAASRRLVRELGFMRDGLAGVDLPPSAVHALLEIEARDGITAAALSGLLGLEKSSVSRLLRKLVEAGEVAEGPAGADGRAKPLSLTPRGRATTGAIHGFARRQVAGALERLPQARHRTVTDGLRLYADALAAGRDAIPASPSVTIEAGYRPGALGRCAEMHARYYAREAGFGASFEALVASGLAEFSGRLDRPCNGLWLALREDRVVGTVAIDGEHLGPGLAHLRWLIVDDGVRGGGAGRALLSAAVGFCEAQGFDAVHLWTFQGLHAARHLYERQGFVLAEQRPGRRWDSEVMEQRFVRPVAKSGSEVVGPPAR